MCFSVICCNHWHFIKLSQVKILDFTGYDYEKSNHWTKRKRIFDTSLPNTSILASISRFEIKFPMHWWPKYQQHEILWFNRLIRCSFIPYLLVNSVKRSIYANMISCREIDARIDVLGNDVSNTFFTPSMVRFLIIITREIQNFHLAKLNKVSVIATNDRKTH